MRGLNKGIDMTIFLRRPAVESRVALSRSQIYALMARGQFPKPVRLGPASVAWVEDEITLWQEQRISESRNTKAA